MINIYNGKKVNSFWWIRRDLRLSDNMALQAALMLGEVIPLFILDPFLVDNASNSRKNFLFNGLRKLDQELKMKGSGLVICKGDPEEVFQILTNRTGVIQVFAEEDYSAYARSRDKKVAAKTKLELISGQTAIHPLLVTKSDGLPYTVFTPYSKKWKLVLPDDIEPIQAPVTINKLPDFHHQLNDLLCNIHDLPPAGSSIEIDLLYPAGEREALKRLDQFLRGKIYSYENDRNRMDLGGTSVLSPYIRFGMISIRQLVYETMRAIRNAPDMADIRSAETWLNELIWREFYQGILYHFPGVLKHSFNPNFENIQWRNSDSDFVAWTAGMTGFPIVDAGMRQLAATGWMHNRARMITASFLVKDLLINWQLGEKWFMQHLVDGEPASNNGGWQWAAGTGTDAAPYFRIFNPVLQSKKFDPDGTYIRKWIPELAHLSNEMIHTPWECGIVPSGYPQKPIVDHSLAKIRTLDAYKLSKSRFQTGDF